MIYVSKHITVILNYLVKKTEKFFARLMRLYLNMKGVILVTWIQEIQIISVFFITPNPKEKYEVVIILCCSVLFS